MNQKNQNKVDEQKKSTIPLITPRQKEFRVAKIIGTVVLTIIVLFIISFGAGFIFGLF